MAFKIAVSCGGVGPTNLENCKWSFPSAAGDHVNENTLVRRVIGARIRYRVEFGQERLAV